MKNIDIYDDFPITEYYKNNVKGAVTIKRGGNWWSAVLLIEEPGLDLLNHYNKNFGSGLIQTPKGLITE